VKGGRIVKVNRSTLNEAEFRVECEYKGEMMEVIADKDEIIEKNIAALLNYYEK